MGTARGSRRRLRPSSLEPADLDYETAAAQAAAWADAWFRAWGCNSQVIDDVLPLYRADIPHPKGGAMRTRIGIMRWVWIVALALGAACGGETATGPSEVPPVVEIPDVAGTYSGTAEAKTLVATGFEGSISGAARLRVEQQGATVTVSGELLVRGPQQNLDATGTIDGQGRFTRTDGVLAHRIEESPCGWMDYEGEPLLSFRDGTAEYGVSLITERCGRLRLGATLTRNNGRPAGPVAMSGSILDCPRKIAGGGYTVCHVDGYGDDARSVRDILDAAIPRLRQRYGPTSTPVDIYLFPEPGTVHGITIQPGTALAYGGPRHLALYLMAVSAPSMQGACCTGLGLTFTDPRYQRTVHVHEFATAFIHHYSGYQKWAGWFVQGLEQYEGLEASGTLWSRVAEARLERRRAGTGPARGPARRMMFDTLSIALASSLPADIESSPNARRHQSRTPRRIDRNSQRCRPSDVDNSHCRASVTVCSPASRRGATRRPRCAGGARHHCWMSVRRHLRHVAPRSPRSVR